jgi:purine-binding chemotaxis protein CheW
VDDVLAVTTYSDDDIDKEAHASQNSERDILGIIRKKTKTADRDKSELIIWLDIKTMIERIERDL